MYEECCEGIGIGRIKVGWEDLDCVYDSVDFCGGRIKVLLYLVWRDVFLSWLRIVVIFFRSDEVFVVVEIGGWLIIMDVLELILFDKELFFLIIIL